MEKTKRNKIPPKKKTSLDFNVDNIDAFYNDFVELMHKYGADYTRAVTIASSNPVDKRGYYTLFIKRDDNLPDGQKIKIASMASQIPLSDLVSIFSHIVDNIQHSKEAVHYA